MPLAEAVLHVHGASRGNPRRGGVGVVLSDVDGNVLYEVSEPLGEATSNGAAYRAWIRGLSLAADLGAKEAIVHSDSEFVIKQLKGEYRIRQEHIRDLFEQVRDQLTRFDRVRIRQIAREENEQADHLAAKAAAGDTEPEGSTLGDLP